MKAAYIVVDLNKKVYLTKRSTLTFSEDKAYQWNTEKEAVAALKNVKKSISNIYDFTVHELNNCTKEDIDNCDEIEEDIDLDDFDKESLSIKQSKTIEEYLSESENSNETWELISYSSYENINSAMKDFETFLREIKLRKQFLFTEIGKCNLELVDIQHAAEFYKLDACQGYKLYKMLHEVRNKRREYKNELIKINAVIKTFANIDISKVNDFIAKVDNQTYKPRILTELFNDKE